MTHYNSFNGIEMCCEITKSYGRYTIRDCNRDIHCSTTDSELYDHFDEIEQVERGYNLLRLAAGKELFYDYDPEQELTPRLADLLDAYDLQKVIDSFPHFQL